MSANRPADQRRTLFPFRLLSLRARITLGSTLIAAFVIVLLVIVMRLQVLTVVASATRTLLNTDADPYVSALEVDDSPHLSRPANGQLVAVIAPKGTLSISTLPRDLEDNITSIVRRDSGASIIRLAGTEYRLVVEHPTNDVGTWTVVAARNTQSETLVVDELTMTLSFTGLAILVAFGAASWLLATAALRPVNRMRREAERLSQTPDRAELPVGPAWDELASLAMTLNAFLARTRQATERERQMVSDASHELRTPLAILTTQLDLASLDVGDANALAAHIDRAKTSVARLSRLANDLLTLSRIEESRHTEDPAEVRTTSWSTLGDEVMAAVDRVRLIAGVKDITVDFDLDAPPTVGGAGPAIGAGTVEPVYVLDTNGIAQLVTNIASNAVSALPRGGSILVRWRVEHGDGILEVTDDGPGVPESFVAVAFDRFTRPDEARSSRRNTADSGESPALGGSGLGLAIVRAIAERAGGSAVLQNINPSGLRVIVRVPAVSPAGGANF